MQNLNPMKSRFYLLILPVLVFCSLQVKGQGCVAIRSFSGFGNAADATAFLGKNEIMVGSNARYFRSYKHFRGTHEETERVEKGTEVINNSAFLDFTINYGLTNRLYANATIPFVFHTRTSLYEHGGNSFGYRGETKASGLGDARIGLGYWLLDPAKSANFNMALGLGLKMPTGKYDAKDTFYNQGPEKDQERELVVDQSIQPGDGGWSPSLDLQSYYIISDNFSVNTTLYYLFGIAESNGVLIRNQPAGGTEFAVPDQYLARLGLTYATPLEGLSIYGGARIEGVPAEDLIGGSNAYRRPGYSIAVEPGLNYNTSNLAITFSVPFAVERNRTQSYLDKVSTAETGEYKHGDAAFADYLLNFGITYRFNNKQHSMMPDVPGSSN